MNETTEQEATTAEAGRVDPVVMHDEKKWLMCDLSDGRTISVFPFDDGSFAFEFNNNGHETRLRLSGEAVQAMHSLWFELCARGIAA